MPADRAPGDAVACIDHLLVATGDADGLFSLFADGFRLPVAWPMADYGGFVSGGTRWGNVNVEVIRDPRPGTVPPDRARCVGIAFEPAGPLETVLARLDARGVARGVPRPGRSWMTAALPGLLPGHSVFFCQYEPTSYGRYPVMTAELRARGGGPLGLEEVAEVVVGVPDPAAVADRWAGVLGPAAPQRPGVWPLGDGPAVRLEPADAERIGRLVVRVRDVEPALRVLRALRLAGAADSRAGSATVDLGGLELQVVATPG
jgi:hypothetical protein